MLDLDVGTGRRVPGRAHSLVRDGCDAPAVIRQAARMLAYTSFWLGIGAVQEAAALTNTAIGPLRNAKKNCQ